MFYDVSFYWILDAILAYAVSIFFYKQCYYYYEKHDENFTSYFQDGLILCHLYHQTAQILIKFLIRM